MKKHARLTRKQYDTFFLCHTGREKVALIAQWFPELKDKLWSVGYDGFVYLKEKNDVLDTV